MKVAMIILSGLLIAGIALLLSRKGTGADPANPSHITRNSSPAAQIAQTTEPLDTTADDSNIVVGLVVPAAETQVRAQVDGVLSRYEKAIGQTIQAGQVLALFDDGDLALAGQQLETRIEAKKHYIDSAKAEVKQLTDKHSQLKALEQHAASAFEVSQAFLNAQIASERLQALEQEQKELQVQARVIDRQREKHRSLSPITGRVLETVRVAGEYVRQGEIIATVQSQQHLVAVNLNPSLLAHGASRLAFTCQQDGREIELSILDTKGSSSPDGSRMLRLAVPSGVELTVGQAVEVKVSVKP